MRISTRALCCVWAAMTCLVGQVAAQDQVDTRPCSACGEVIVRVQALLPERPDRIVVVDGRGQSRLRQQQIQHAEGFVQAGDLTVFLKLEGPTFQRALGGAGIRDYVLAVIVWHEMAHLAGADQPGAQRQEEALWQQLIVQQRIDSHRGLGYLRLLPARRTEGRPK